MFVVAEFYSTHMIAVQIMNVLEIVTGHLNSGNNGKSGEEEQFSCLFDPQIYKKPLSYVD